MGIEKITNEEFEKLSDEEFLFLISKNNLIDSLAATFNISEAAINYRLTSLRVKQKAVLREKIDDIFCDTI